MNVPDDLLYTKDHEWIFLDGPTGLVGITDYAQSALGDITFVELPKVGQDAEQGDQLASVESVKAASDIFSPMAGNVIEVNGKLESDPGLINRSCYEKGWIAKIQVADMEEKSNLMNAEDYRKFLESLEEKE